MTWITDPYSFDELKLEIDANGYAHSHAKIMKAGQLKYRTIDGQELYANISLDDLKKAADTIDSMGPITITHRHPSDMVTPKDVKKYQVGVTKGKPKIMEIDGEQWLVDGVILQDEKAINIAKEGKIGGSAGYWRDALKAGDGVVDFKNIVPNHYAIGCESPRAKGAGLFSLDSTDHENGHIFEVREQQTIIHNEVNMKRILNAVTGQGFSLDEAPIEYDAEKSENAVETLVKREKSLISQLEKVLTDKQKSFDDATAELKEKTSTLTGENKGLLTKVETLESQLKNTISMDEVEKVISELAHVRNVAEKYKVKTEIKNAHAGRVEVIKQVLPNVSFDENDKSEVVGIFKTIDANEKSIKEDIKSRAALNGQSQSMDSADKISFSDIDVDALIKLKKQKRA